MRGGARGNAAIEFALLMPLMLLLLAGIIDGSLFLIDRHAAVRAARDGARVAATVVEDPPVTGAEIEAAAVQYASESLAAAEVEPMSITADWSTDEEGWSWITITIVVRHRAMFGPYSPFSRDIVHAFTMLTQEQVN